MYPFRKNAGVLKSPKVTAAEIDTVFGFQITVAQKPDGLIVVVRSNQIILPTKKDSARAKAHGRSQNNFG